jgi:hypothetical protein
MGGQCHAPTEWTPGKKTSIQSIGDWMGPGPVCKGAENFIPTGTWSPDRPVCSETLYAGTTFKRNDVTLLNESVCRKPVCLLNSHEASVHRAAGISPVTNPMTKGKNPMEKSHILYELTKQHTVSPLIYSYLWLTRVSYAFKEQCVTVIHRQHADDFVKVGIKLWNSERAVTRIFTEEVSLQHTDFSL